MSSPLPTLLPLRLASVPAVDPRSSGLKDGPAKYLLVPVREEIYANQPLAASSETSTILSWYKIVIKQGDKTVNGYEPVGELVDDEWEAGLSVFGEMACVERGTEIVYGQKPHHSKLAILVNRVAIRLKDHGARFQLHRLSRSSNGFAFALPGPLPPQKRRGTYGPAPTSPNGCTLDPKFTWVKLNVPITTEHSVIFKVNESVSGTYNSLQYCLRSATVQPRCE